MSRRCPCCDLPITVGDLGAAVAATSNDRQVHGAYALCTRCTNENRRLPIKTRLKRICRAGDRALDQPDRYLCALFPDIAQARLAVAMLGHPQHAQAAVLALGWSTETLSKN